VRLHFGGLARGRGDGTFDAPVASPSWGNPTRLALGDFDGDSRPPRPGGRTYLVTYRATDAAGNVSRGLSRVLVPATPGQNLLAASPANAGGARQFGRGIFEAALAVRAALIGSRDRVSGAGQDPEVARIPIWRAGEGAFDAEPAQVGE